MLSDNHAAWWLGVAAGGMFYLQTFNQRVNVVSLSSESLLLQSGEGVVVNAFRLLGHIGIRVGEDMNPGSISVLLPWERVRLSRSWPVCIYGRCVYMAGVYIWPVCIYGRRVYI
jgi:hypothetical protein